MSIRVLIVDDHAIIRAGLRTLLGSESDLEVVGEAGNGSEALRAAIELRPDVILLDISMPGQNGIEVTRQLRRAAPQARVLILTVHEDESLLRAAIQAGAVGYIIKRAAKSELVNAVTAASRGEMYVHPAMTHLLLRDLSPLHDSNPIGLESLSSREREVLRLIARGHTNTQIAKLLGLSVRTVEGHRANLMSKLNLHSRVELTNYAEEHGLL